jgi:hypothetical protein
MAGPITHVPDRHDDMEFREAPPHTAAEIVAELEKLGTSDLSVRAHKVLKGEF